MQEKKTTKVIFSAELGKLFEETGQTQKQFAERFGVSQATVFKWLNGSIPSGDKITHLAQYFDVLEDQLLNGGCLRGSRSNAWRAANPKGEVLRGSPGKAITSFTGPSEVEHWRDKAVVAERKVERLKKMLQEALAEL